MSIWKYDSDGLYGENYEDRKKKFCKIGEKVYSFFQDKAIEAGFQERIGQWEMSCEIVDGVKDRKHVLVEAGVGIGKSFAYIVPLLYYNQMYHKAVVIATSTIALQEQLVHDLEKIMDMLDYTVEVLIAKGQNHFLCKKRFDECFTSRFIQENEEHQLMNEKISKYGYEKSDWDIVIPDEIWNRINVKEYNPQFCRVKCSYCETCHYNNLRKKMLHTNGIIVCNQDLLTINMNNKASDRKQLMNEEIGVVVIDEAHNLENKVRSSVTDYISMTELKEAMRGAGKAIDSFDSSFTVMEVQAERIIDKFFQTLKKQMEEQDKRTVAKGQDIERYYVKIIGEELEKLIDILKDIQLKASMTFGNYIGNHHRRSFDEEIERLEDDIVFLESLNKRASSKDIFWLEREKGNRSENAFRLYKCPKNVDKIMQKILFSDSDLPVILTSATITSGKKTDNYIENYSYFLKNTGLQIEKNMVCEPKDSPFNYNEHAKIYYTEHMPHPTKDRDKFIEEGVKEIVSLLRITNGKALVLFTAKTDMLEVYNRLLKENLPFEIIMQSGNSKQAETLDKFRKNINSVLLGTGSYWEGINIEGVSLSHVIIFKLPFPVREPIIDYKYEQSENGLMEVSVPEMIIKLKQGIGRLIRSEKDRGIISIIDSRVGDESKAPYREIIWESLPIKRRTNEIEKIEQFYHEVVECVDEG